MSAKTKIVVLRMKEIIYTAIFIGLGILLIALFLIMFHPKQEASPASAEANTYIPGIYTSTLNLGSQEVNVEVAVDANRIRSISMVSLSESVETMFPLVQPALENLTAQICESQSLENLTYPEDTKYTSEVLVRTIRKALSKAGK